MNDRELHAHLIGQQGGRKAFNTPVLVIDLDALERNIATMAKFAKERGIALRPHAMSVTEIEHWLRDPYTIYARHILRLDPLDPVDMPLVTGLRADAVLGEQRNESLDVKSFVAYGENSH